MFSRVNNYPNIKRISCPSNYGPKPRLVMMSPGVTEPVIQNNELESSPKVPRSTESHQPLRSPSSNSSNAQWGKEKPEHSFQDAIGEPNGHIDPARSSRHTPKILPPSCDEPREDDDHDPITPTTESYTTARDTSSHVPNIKVDHGKKAALPEPMGPEPLVTSEPSEPAERQTVAANFQPVDDDPVYDIGDIKVYDQNQKAIPRLYESRWQVISPEIFDRVHERLRRGRFTVRLNKARAPTTIELMSAGLTKASSMPAVVVVVPKHAKKMQNFLNTDSTVQNRCKPGDGTTVELLALACKGSSTLIGMSREPFRSYMESPSDSDSSHSSDDDDSLNLADGSDSSAGLHSLTKVLEVDARSVSIVHEPNNIEATIQHGMGIRVVIQGSSQYMRGTCGGFLRLTFPNSPPRQVGLIAGHLLEQLSQAIEEEKQKNVPESSEIIGDIFYPKNSGDVPRYDWALFDVTEPGFEHSMVSYNGFSVAQESEIPDMSILVAIGTSRGEMKGTLSSSTSGIMLNPDQGFVHVRTITMDEGKSLLYLSL